MGAIAIFCRRIAKCYCSDIVNRDVSEHGSFANGDNILYGMVQFAVDVEADMEPIH